MRIAQFRLACPSPKCNSTLAERVKTSLSGHQRFLVCQKCGYEQPKDAGLIESQNGILTKIKGAKFAPVVGAAGKFFYLHPNREKFYVVEVYPSRAVNGPWFVANCTCSGFSSHSRCKHADFFDLMLNSGEDGSEINRQRAQTIWSEKVCSECKGTGEKPVFDEDWGSRMISCKRLCFLNHRKPVIDVSALLAS